MKETLKNGLHSKAESAIQKVIRREYDGWPPVCYGALYQPHRPEKKPAAAQTKTPNK